MKEHKGDLLVIIIFIFFLVGPSIIYPFVEKYMDHGNYEKREMIKKPKLTLKNIKDYPKKYEDYFNDNLAFKNEIRKYRAEALYKVLNTAADARVLIGKNDFLFYDGTTDGNTINNYRKIARFTKKEKEKIKDNLVETKDYFQKQGKPFYVIMVPDKENVYREYMPDVIESKKSSKASMAEDLINYLKENTDLNILYLKDALMKGKDKGRVFLRYDTHWTDYGAYLGVMEIVSNIEKDYQKPEVTFKKGTTEYDLANMSLISNIINKKDLVTDKFLEDVDVTCKEKDEYQVCNSNGQIDKTLILTGDSFRLATIQFLSKIYKRTVFINVLRDDYSDVIKKYDADVLLFESVERYATRFEDANKMIGD